MSNSRVLVLSGHPNLAESFANRAILDHLGQAAPTTDIRRLDALYPDYRPLDVAAEQAALLPADVIVWQFPIQWFAVPDLFKRWMDHVLTHGFAYGSKGIFLHGKKVILSCTVGGSAQDYSLDGVYQHPVEDFLLPLTESIRYCGMEYVGNVYSVDMTHLPGIHDEAHRQGVHQRAAAHAQDLLQLIAAQQH